jgi:hypothetical protein
MYYTTVLNHIMLREDRTMGWHRFEYSKRGLMLFRAFTASEPVLDVNIGRAVFKRILSLMLAGLNEMRAAYNYLVSLPLL